MGYLITGFALVVIVVLFGVLMARTGNRPSKPVVDGDQPPQRTEPSADEPNPANSSIATPAQQERARQHLPPA